jgi:enterobactin synthetase component F
MPERPSPAETRLTQAELGLWYAQRIDPANPVFNTGQYLEMIGPLDIEAFARAVNTVMTEAESLALRVVEEPDGPKGLVDRTRMPVLQQIDLTDTENPHAEAMALINRDMSTAVDPRRDALAAQVLFLLGPEQHIWYQRIHHLAIDGYGTALITTRIADLYRAAVTDGAPRTAPLAPRGAAVAGERDYVESDRYQTDRRFWLEQFADHPEATSLVSRATLTSHTYLSRAVGLPPDVSDGLVALSSRTSVVWPDVLAALSAAYIQRHAGGTEAIIGLPAMERLGRPTARVPAMVMNILPARVAIDEDRALDDWLKDTARHLQRLRRHGRYRGEQLRRDLGLVGSSRRLHGPLVNVLPFDTPLDLPGLDVSLHIVGTGPVDDLTLTWRADGAGRGLRLEIDANPALYTATDLDVHAVRLTTFLARALTAASLAEVPTLTPPETRRWVLDVNQASHAVPSTTLHELIERQMRRRPAAPALRFEGQTWSYAELDRITRAIAYALVARGVGANTIVAVMAPRSFELVAALIGILRAGGAYLPLDPAWPDARIVSTLETSGARLVLAFDHDLTRLPDGTATLALDIPALLDAPEIALPRVSPADAAYVIYTSGSTGAPKGAVIEHRAIVNRLEWMREFYDFDATDRLLQKTPATFDVSVWEFFLAFTTGAMLVVAPPGVHRDPAALAALIAAERVTTVHFVPSMLAVFLAEPGAAGLRLRRVFCSGEELPAALRDRFHQVVRADLHNLYGPTEAAVDVTWWHAHRHDDSNPVPIGYPVWNTQMYILDGRLRPVPPGVAGDLYIAGVQLAREYLNRPDLTAERFVANPFGPPGSRMYKTGDLARWRSDGAIEFLGRSDFQVKIRGFRIELGEIEAALAAAAGTSAVVVIAREDRPGDRQLVAYIAGRVPDFDITAIRAALARQLPEYMVPSAFVVLDTLPVSANGKLDRKALPPPERRDHDRPLRAPRTETERVVVDVFTDVLGTSTPPGVDDDFFAMGGHSLLAAQLMNQLRARLGVDGGLGVVFAHPTPARLAEYIDRRRGETDAGRMEDRGLGPVILLNHGGKAELPPLFCIHPAGGLAWCYSRLARALDPPRRVYGLQAGALDPDAAQPESLDEMAAEYAARIQAIQPSGEYDLAGWSVGGILAHTVGVHLRGARRQVRRVTLFDAYPCDRWRDAPPPDAAAGLRALLLVAGHDPAAVPPSELTKAGVLAFLRAANHPLGTLADGVLDGVMRIVSHNSLLVRRHVHRVFDGDVLFFRAALDHAGTTLSPEEWRPYVGGRLEVHDVASLHPHLMGPEAVVAIARTLNRLEAGSQT